MNLPGTRRQFLMSAALAPAALAVGGHSAAAYAEGKVARTPGVGIRLALNAYSFNRPLSAGSMSLLDLVDYCAQHGLHALDATGYYFPGYPEAPSDEFIYTLKKRAFVNGVTINGTGVRNDFAVPEAASRDRDVQMVKAWVEAASKLGASVVRVFSGKAVPEGHTFEKALDWMVPDFIECAEHGERHGVLVGLQNHHDFAKTADETIQIVKAVDSEWFGVILDVGSLRQSDPYEEIAKLLPYAVSWQLKETVWYGTKEVPTDLAKVKAIIDEVGYRGFLPIETLGPGDPRVKVAGFLEQVRAVFGA
jgi:sugar phosphate isomerase/epimerase